jgi:general secretion pathway protein C
MATTTTSASKSSSPHHWPWRHGLTLLAWSAAAASLVYWFLQFPVQDSMRPASETLTVSHRTQAPSNAGLGRALGVVTATAAAPTPQAARFQLMGVIAASSGQGSALIGTDGLPPKAYRLGQVVADGLTLADLKPRQVKLKSPGTELLLELVGLPEKP